MVVNIVRCKGAMVFGCSNSQLAEKPPYRSRVKVPGAWFPWPRKPTRILVCPSSYVLFKYLCRGEAGEWLPGAGLSEGTVMSAGYPILLQGWCTASRAATMSSPRGSPSAKPVCPAAACRPYPDTDLRLSLDAEDRIRKNRVRLTSADRGDPVHAHHAANHSRGACGARRAVSPILPKPATLP